MLALFLLACADEKPRGGDGAPGDTAADTAADSAADTGDDGLAEAWEPPDVACALTTPLPLSAGALPSLGDVYGPSHIDLASLWYDAASYAEAWECPAYSADSAAGVETCEGMCAVEDLTWEGRFRATYVEGAGDSLVERFDAEGVRFVETFWRHYEVSLDGYSAYERVADGVWLGERVLEMSLAGYSSDLDGEWSVSATESWTEGVSTTLQARVTASTALLDGSYCLFQESYELDGCDEEPWGGLVLQGDARVVVTYDPEVACDGCGDVTVDGAPAGQLCGGEWAP